jgi:hypothetical protein
MQKNAKGHDSFWKRLEEKIDSLKDSPDNSYSAMTTRYEADRLSTGALADGPSTDVLTTQGFVTDKTSATDNMPQNSQASLGMWPYEMEYQVVAESTLVGWKSFFVESSWWRVRVLKLRNTAFLQERIVGTTAFDGGGVTIWGC